MLRSDLPCNCAAIQISLILSCNCMKAGVPTAANDCALEAWECVVGFMALCLGGSGSAHLLRGLVAHGASAAVHAHQVASGGKGMHVGLDVIYSQPAIKGALVGSQHLAWRHAWGASE